MEGPRFTSQGRRQLGRGPGETLVKPPLPGEGCRQHLIRPPLRQKHVIMHMTCCQPGMLSQPEAECFQELDPPMWLVAHGRS